MANIETSGTKKLPKGIVVLDNVADVDPRKAVIFTSKTEALNALDNSDTYDRVEGLKLKVLKNGKIVEHIFDGGIANANFIPLFDLSNIEASTGLETKDQGNGPGLVKKSRNEAYYGNIGRNAVDVSINFSNSNRRGATGENSFTRNKMTIASGENSTAGGDSCEARNKNSLAEGKGNISEGEEEATFGRYGTRRAQGDRIFNIGNGTDNNKRNDAFSVFNNGETKVITAAEFSLRKLKENIKTYKESGLDKIKNLDIVKYDLKSGIKNKVGIIADDTDEEFLTEANDAVDLYKAIFIQAKAIQELNQKVETQEQRINDLEKIVNKLKK